MLFCEDSGSVRFLFEKLCHWVVVCVRLGHGVASSLPALRAFHGVDGCVVGIGPPPPRRVFHFEKGSQLCVLGWGWPVE